MECILNTCGQGGFRLPLGNVYRVDYGWLAERPCFFDLSLLQASTVTTNPLKPTQRLPGGLKLPTLGYDNRLGSYAVLTVDN
jgi:hypothetical protein